LIGILHKFRFWLYSVALHYTNALAADPDWGNYTYRNYQNSFKTVSTQ